MQLILENIEKIILTLICGIIPGVAVLIAAFRVRKNNEVTLISRKGFTSKWRLPKSIKGKSLRNYVKQEIIFGIVIILFSIILLMLEILT